MPKSQAEIWPTIVVTYDGFAPALDQRITATLEAEGFVWYASGFDGKTRDLAFDLPKETREGES